MLEEKPQISEEIRVIPWWAFLLAALLFAGIQMLLHLVAFRRDPHPPPFPLQIFIGFMAGGILAFLTLLIIYVNRDAKRRGMNVTLWTIAVIFIPNAIGFVLYFLLRQPLASACPQCATMVNRGLNYCPKCRFALHPACPECHRAVRVGDTYCPYCAYELKPIS
jgi:RNA polymerase subunit RPABC4/transcription elongation factor Spt4